MARGDRSLIGKKLWTFGSQRTKPVASAQVMAVVSFNGCSGWRALLVKPVGSVVLVAPFVLLP